SCAATATAAYLGAWWLKVPVMGLPTGAWLIAIAQGAAVAWDQRNRQRGNTGSGAVHEKPGAASLDTGGLTGRVAAAAVDAACAVARALPIPAERINELDGLISDRLDRMNWSGAPLRIGIDAPADTTRALLASPGLIDQRWINVGPERDNDASMRRHGLD